MRPISSFARWRNVLFGSSVDKAAAQLRKLLAKRAELVARIESSQQQIAEFRNVSGEVLLDAYMESAEGGAQRVQARARIAEVEQEIADLRSATGALCGRISQTIRDLGKARADVIRGDARKLREKFDSHQAETRRLLGLLLNHEGVEFAQMAPQIPPANVAHDPVRIPISNSDRLQLEIGTLEKQALQIEREATAKASRGWHVDACDLPGLLDAVAASESCSPLPAVVEAWFGRVTAAAPQTWFRFAEGERPPEGPRRYTLAWGPMGEINAEASVCVLDVSPNLIDRRLTRDEERQAGKDAVRLHERQFQTT